MLKALRCLNSTVMFYVLSDDPRGQVFEVIKKTPYTKMLSQIICKLDLSVHFLQSPRRLHASQ